ncbi:MAG TPA: alpha-L-arabinofuranosidase C-terminal domain-containing protein [Acidothermaceae bacterium]
MTNEPAATVTLDSAFVVGAIDRRLFGSFVEHMGRCLYSGIFEPDHASADEWGFRRDVAELIGELGTSLVRYPGGNFVSGYDWRDGIGPVADRPTRLDLAWRSIEPNLVGVDEFLPWARRLGLTPMMAVNLGTAGVADAAALVEYCNVAGGTYWSDARRKNGTVDPYGVGLWCLGNEMDGEWQIGHKNADDYGKLANEAGKAMKLVDPTIELVACGSSNHEMETFGRWESTVLEHTFEVADYISMHAYYQGAADRRDFLASGASMDRFIRDVLATADAVAARKKSRKRINISFDEWNVWSSEPDPVKPERAIQHAPRIAEDTYQPLDAVVVGDLFSTLLNHADRVTVACLSLLVNVSAPIITEPSGFAWRQSTFYPLAVAQRLATGNSLRSVVSAPDHASPRYGDVPALSVAATLDEQQGRLSLFLVNRSATQLSVEVNTGDLEPIRVRRAGQVTAASKWHPGNSDSLVEEISLERIAVEPRRLALAMRPESWVALDIEIAKRPALTVRPTSRPGSASPVRPEAGRATSDHGGGRDQPAQ